MSSTKLIVIIQYNTIYSFLYNLTYIHMHGRVTTLKAIQGLHDVIFISGQMSFEMTGD